jgi:hypothetical protein
MSEPIAGANKNRWCWQGTLAREIYYNQDQITQIAKTLICLSR